MILGNHVARVWHQYSIIYKTFCGSALEIHVANNAVLIMVHMRRNILVPEMNLDQRINYHIHGVSGSKTVPRNAL